MVLCRFLPIRQAEAAPEKVDRVDSARPRAMVSGNVVADQEQAADTILPVTL